MIPTHSSSSSTPRSSDADITNIVIEKKLSDNRLSEFPLYYRFGAVFQTKEYPIKEICKGFSVERIYASVDNDPHKVWKDEHTGIWNFVKGTEIRVLVKMETPKDRWSVALVDYVPAGAEIIIPEVITNLEVTNQSKQIWYHKQHWYDAKHMRANRVEAYQFRISKGEYELSYTMKAVYTGIYFVPPAKAEEIYQSKVFGYSKVEQVVIL